MRITIAAWGGHGDVRPCVALALGLQRAGHVVRFATHVEDVEFVSSFGVDCLPMEWDAKENPLLINCQPFITISQNSDQVRSPKNSLLSELWRVCQNAEAIIFNGPSYPCYYIAEKLGIPCYAVSPQPHHQTQAFPHPFVTDGKSLGSIYNWFSYPFFDQVFWQYIRKPINDWRQETLQLPPLSIWEGLVGRMQRQKLPFLYSYSPSFLPKPSDWNDDCIHVTGYWFLDTSENWQPPTDLVNFLSAGSPPVYITNIWHEEMLGKKVVQKIAALTEQRIIVQTDDESCDTESTDKIFYIKGLIPHEWLFPKMAAIVHHGGCGTTMSCLRAGVPTIVIPLKSDNDHSFWALQLAKSGNGIFLVPQKEQLLIQSLASAIRVAIADKNMKHRVVQMSKRVQAEDGVSRAVEAFHQHLPAI